jgi:hypothetical protein
MSFEAPPLLSENRFSQTAALAMQLAVRWPEDLRQPAKIAANRAQRVADVYDPWVMGGTRTDCRVVLRVLRRGYAQAELGQQTTRLVSDPTDNVDNTNIGPYADHDAATFAAAAGRTEQVAIVILFQQRGSGTDCNLPARGPSQQGAGAQQLRDRAGNRSAQLPINGHFAPAVDRRIARRTPQVIPRYTKKSVPELT